MRSLPSERSTRHQSGRSLHRWTYSSSRQFHLMKIFQGSDKQQMWKFKLDLYINKNVFETYPSSWICPCCGPWSLVGWACSSPCCSPSWNWSYSIFEHFLDHPQLKSIAGNDSLSQEIREDPDENKALVRKSVLKPSLMC